MPKKEVALKNTTILIAYLLVVWGFYRFLFKLPEEIEEIVIKPILWLTPLIYFLKKEGAKLSSLGITTKNLFPSLYIALALGVIFALEGLVINLVKYSGVNFSANIGTNFLFKALVLSLATSVTEEITFRGYIFGRIWYIVGKEWTANLLTSFIWALIHIPVAIFWWNLPLGQALLLLILTIIFGIGSAFIYARTRNIASSIFLHFLWEWPIILFR